MSRQTIRTSRIPVPSGGNDVMLTDGAPSSPVINRAARTAADACSSASMYVTPRLCTWMAGRGTRASAPIIRYASNAFHIWYVEYFLVVPFTNMRDRIFVTIHDLSNVASDAIRSEVDRMALGDSSCSLENMQTSCFASELCQDSNGRHVSSSFSGGVWRAPYKYVALHNGTVVGFACAIPTSTLSYIPPEHTGYCISNVCVRDTYRSHGVGQQLLSHMIRKLHRKSVYISVLMSATASPLTVQSVMDTRSTRLVSMYKKFGFEHVCTKSNYTVLKYST